jgi:SAM-dependent methyltransferase
MSGAGQRSRRTGSYILPHHPTEVDRLDIQHYALREALGSNYRAPLERPERILDVGCGTGLWAYELCVEYQEALVVGLDLQPSKPERPANFRLVRANLLSGLPFPDGSFDFVHQRLLMAGVPLKSWAAVVADLVRVLRPGGWLQLVETAPGPEPAGPATERLFDLLRRLGRQVGLDTTGIVFQSMDRYLARAGLTSVEVTHVHIPCGEWGGNIGSLLASNHRALFTRLGTVFQAQFGLGEEEIRGLVSTSLQELDQYRTVLTFGVGIGQKPCVPPP